MTTFRVKFMGLAAAGIASIAMATGASAQNWSGTYAGVTVGKQWDQNHWSTGLIGNPLHANDRKTGEQDFNGQGFRFGGFAGYNWQMGSMIVGAEADIGAGKKSKKSIDFIPGTANAIFTTALRGDTSTVSSGLDGSVRGRIGYLLSPTILAYGTGGLAVQQSEIGASCVTVSATAGNWCVANRTDSTKKLMMGWTLGGGVEVQAAKNWLVRLEYRYSDYGSREATLFGGAPVDQVQMKLDSKSQDIMLGVAYKF
jgi:outer membrane immunogenic protein